MIVNSGGSVLGTWWEWAGSVLEYAGSLLGTAVTDLSLIPIFQI